MKKTIVSLGFGLVAMGCCSVGCPSIFYGEDPAGQPVHQYPGWPKGLAELLTRGGRIYSCTMGWLGGDEHSFYFSGDTDDFNWFLQRWAKLKDVSRTLGLHPGRGEVKGIISKQPIGPFDWKVTVRAHWARSGRSFEIQLELWVGGKGELQALKIPRNVEVRAAGEGELFKQIETFIAERNAKRRHEEKKEETR